MRRAPVRFPFFAFPGMGDASLGPASSPAGYGAWNQNPTMTYGDGSQGPNPYYTALPEGGPPQNPLSAGDSSYLLYLYGQKQDGPTPWANVFAELGLTASEIATVTAAFYASVTPGWPEGAAPQTNWAPSTPNATTASSTGSGPGGTVMAGQSIAPASAGSSSVSGSNVVVGSTGAVVPATGCDFALFGDSGSCIGGVIGSTTLLVLGAAALLLFFMGGKK